MKQLYKILSATFLFNLLFQISYSQSKTNWHCFSRDELIYDIAFNNQDVWIASRGGLAKFDRINNFTTCFNAANSPLHSNEIREIEFDVYGNLWIAMNYGDLVKYDGTTWEHFVTLNGVDTLVGIINILTSPAGDVYVVSGYNGSLKGLYKYDGSSFNNINVPMTQWWAFGIDTLGSIYCSGSAPQLAKYDGNNWTVLDTLISSLPGSTYDILIGKNNNLCAIMIDSGLYKLYIYDGTIWTYYSPSITGIPENKYFRMKKDALNNLLFYGLSINGLVKYDGSTFVNIDSTLLKCNAYGLYIANGDSAGSVWYMTNQNQDSSLVEFDGVKAIKHFMSNSQLSDDHIYDVEIAPDGTKWVSHFYAGIQKFDGYTWTNYDKGNSGISSNNIFDITFDNNGVLWTCSNDDTASNFPVSSFDGNIWTSYPLAYFGQNPRATRCEVDDFNNTWIVLSTLGVAKFDGTNWEYWNAQDLGNPYFYALDIAIDTNNIIWIATYLNGILYYDGINWNEINMANSNLPSNDISSIYADKNNNIWFTCPGGMWGKYDGSNFTIYTNNNWPTEGFPWSIAEDADNNMWFGTSKGLSKFDGANWTNYNQYNSGVGGYVGRIKIDGGSNLWIAGLNGFFTFNETANDFPYWYNFPKLKFEGRTFIDVDTNVVYNLNVDLPLAGTKLICLSDSTQTISNSIGDYRFYKKSGNYLSAFMPNNNWILTTDSLSYFAQIDTNSILNLDYGFKPSSIINSMNLEVTNSSNRCYRPNQIWMNYKNTGTSIANGIAKLILHDSLTYISASPAPDSILNNSYFWNYDSLIPSEQRQILIHVTNPTENSVFDTITSIASIMDASGDTTIKNIKQFITCSYDPNNKEVEPLGLSQFHFIKLGDSLEYTIHFQNLGNDTAISVIVIDTLSSNFDFLSFELLSSSHNCDIDLNKNGVLSITFLNIMLPCSLQNAYGSCGYFKFRIFPKPTVTHNTKVENKAFIYFDFNSPIVTNSTSNIYLNPAISIDENNKKTDVIVWPNPCSDFFNIKINNIDANMTLCLIDISGKLFIVKHQLKFNETIDIKGLAQGVYFATIFDGKNIFKIKIIKI